jgi:hypothetical protein
LLTGPGASLHPQIFRRVVSAWFGLGRSSQGSCFPAHQATAELGNPRSHLGSKWKNFPQYESQNDRARRQIQQHPENNCVTCTHNSASKKQGYVSTYCDRRPDKPQSGNLSYTQEKPASDKVAAIMVARAKGACRGGLDGKGVPRGGTLTGSRRSTFEGALALTHHLKNNLHLKCAFGLCLLGF